MSLNENDNSHCYYVNQANQEYQKNRNCLIDIQTETRKSFLNITEILKPSTFDALECVDIEDLSIAINELGVSNESTQNLLKVETFDINNPAIAILGQVKAGKSTFVNAMLRKNVVHQDYERCTARLTRLTYSEKNYVQLLDKDGNILKETHLRNCKIPKSYVKLNEQTRHNLDEITKEVKAGIKCNFLKNGIDIIDTPGLSEHSTLSNLSKDMVKNIIPVMIYVIDGRTSVKQTDICDLIELKNAVPNLQIIYFISKLDSDDIIETELENIDESESFKIKIANEKLSIAFRKLQWNNLIQKNYIDWKDCPYFHGASFYCLIDYLKNIKTQETQFHFDLFCRFEIYLSKCLLIHFENKIITASNSLIYFQMDVLTKIINRGKSLKDFSKKNLIQIKNIKKIEKDLFEKIKSVINNTKWDLRNLLINKLKSETEMIYQNVHESHYPISFGIPQSGMIVNRKTIACCQQYLINIICQGFEYIIMEFVENELYNKYRMAIEDQLSERMRTELNIEQSKLSGNNPYSMCLKRILAKNYKYSFSSNKAGKSENYGLIFRIFITIIMSIKRFLSKTFQIKSFRGCVDVNSYYWKNNQVQQCLDVCDYSLLADDVCLNLVEDFQNKHNSFLNALEAEERYMQKKFKISDVIRNELINQSPNFTKLLMKTLDVKGRYMLKELKTYEKIGHGAQGEVYRCNLNGKNLAMKIRLNIEDMGMVAEEVYYSYLFEHPRLLPFIAISITKVGDDERFNVSIFTPLMKTDVLNYIKTNDTTLKERLKIGLQTVEALQYLHNQEIMHRDLKLANILLDSENNVFLADYGCCKSTGIACNSIVGTPIHMAPEVIMNNYNFKIDIYSFGILLWYLVEGKGKHPQHVRGNEPLPLLYSAANGQRPERLEKIPLDLWNLMSACWDGNPDSRPNADSIIENLESIINKMF